LGDTSQSWNCGGIGVTLTRYPAEQRQPRHRHENLTYFLLLGGEFFDESTEIGTASPTVLDLLFHPAGAWHEGMAGPTGRFGLNIEPTAAALEQFDLGFEDLGPYRVDSQPIRALELLRQASCGFEAPDAEDRLIESLLPPANHIEETPTWVAKLDDLTTGKSGAHWGLRSLAGELHVHPVYLARVFRARYGHSVTEWFLKRRILESARLLLAEHPASEVAFDAGFADQSHFGRAFRTYIGTSPAKFQRHWLR